MSLKFILLCFTTFLLVQSSFGRAVPEESLENEIAPTESKDNESSSSEEQCPKYYPNAELFLKERKFALKTIHDVFEGLGEIKEGVDLPMQFIDKVLGRITENVMQFSKTLTSEENDYLFSLLKANAKELEKELYTILHNLYQAPKMSDSEESSDNEVLTVKDKKKIFLIQQVVNSAYLAYNFDRGNITDDEFSAGIVEFYKDTVKEYYDSLTKEEQEKKKAYMDMVEELTVESAFEEGTEEEDAEEFEQFAKFFELTDIEKFKISVLYAAQKYADKEDGISVSHFKEQAEKFANSLPNEKSELKKSFADHLEQLNNIDDDGKQIMYIATWMLTLKDDEEERQEDS